MKILIVTKGYYPHGDATGAVVRNVTEALIAQGHSVHVAGLSGEKADTAVTERRGERITNLYVPEMRSRAQLMRDLGVCQSASNAFLINIGLETLHLRVPRHCENALAIAKFLKDHPKVDWVNYAGLPGDKYYDLAQKYMPSGVCGVLCFGPKGGKEGAMRFTNALKLISIETHVADAKSCVLHPASHTHRQLNEQQLVEAGVLPELIRLSVGIESLDDLLADISQALDEV